MRPTKTIRALPLAMSPVMTTAVMKRLKYETRRLVGTSNSKLSIGRWDQLPDTDDNGLAMSDAGNLLGRVYLDGKSKNARVWSKFEPQQLLWLKQKGGAGRDLPVCLHVTEVVVQRLSQIDATSALREGILAFDQQLPDDMATLATMNFAEAGCFDRAFATLVSTMAPSARASALVLRTYERGRATPIDCFGALWETLHGKDTWSKHAQRWVWVVKFLPIKLGVDEALRCASAGTLHYFLPPQ